MNATLEKATKTKKYFVKDESLHGVDNDQFNYGDIAHVLDEVIVTNTPPYNIAIIGKWGLGKSSLINLVTEKYKKDHKHYQVQEINAWKYEKESLRKVFLKQLWQGISNQQVHSFETVRKQIMDIAKEEIPTGESKGDNARTIKFWLTLIAIIAITMVAFVAYKLVQATETGTAINTWMFWRHVFLRYCKNVSTVLIGPALVALCKLVFDDYHAKQTKKIELNFPLETTDDYEIFLETKIKEKLNENPDLKIITVIDDLDRLSIDKIVEALDALKAFVGFDRCIFIVPFDDEIIKRALDERRARDFNKQSEIAEVIESELILDKLFQFKIYLPPLLEFDIQKYAFNLVKQEVPDFLSHYCNEQLMQKVIERILIYPGVTTPRQVKKLLNSFINNLMIVSARESSGKIEKGLLTSEDGIMQIAKMSVLQADFNCFYDLLFKDMRCMDTLLEAHRGELVVEDLPKYLRSFFVINQEKLALKAEYEPLVNFLSRTAKYRVPSIAPYLYLAQDDISIKTGDELQRRAVNALKSGNIRTLKDLLTESSGLSEVITYILAHDAGDLLEMLSTATCVFDSVERVYRRAVAQKIIERTLELSFADLEFLYTTPAEIILAISKYGEKKEFNDDYLMKYLTVLADEKLFNEASLCAALNTLFTSERILSHVQKAKLKDICNLCIQKKTLSPIPMFKFVEPESIDFTYYWGLPWFQKLCIFMEEVNDFSANTAEQVIRTFTVLRDSISCNNLIEPVVPLVQYAAFLPILLSLLDKTENSNSQIKFKTRVSGKIATQIAQSVMEHDFEKNEEVICSIMTGLPFEISEENSDVFDKFALNYAKSYLLDDTLVYCGESDYFELIPKTISDLTTAIFRDQNNDDLLAKIAKYFTEAQRNTLVKKLLEQVSVNGSRNYERELEIIRILSTVEVYAQEMEKVSDRLTTHWSSYYSYENYRKFVSEAMGYLKCALSETAIDKYVNTIMARFTNYRQYCLEALDRVTMTMSAESFKGAFEKIIASSESADFELALDVIINHNKIRPTDDNSQKNYANFLIKNLRTSQNPNRILHVLRECILNYDKMEEMAKGAQENSAIDEEELANTIAHFLNQEEDLRDISDIIRRFCEAQIKSSTIAKVIDKLSNYSKDAIYQQLVYELESVKSKSELQVYVQTACFDIKNEFARAFVLACLRKSFDQVNLSDCSVDIINQITQNEEYFKGQKTDVATVLREGFKTTTSDILKKSILSAVSFLKIKVPFRKTLDGDDLDYYKKWTT